MDASPLPAVVGANCRRIRTEADVTQSQLASHARRVGLHWTSSKVGDFESGRSDTPFRVILAVVLALENAISAGHSETIRIGEARKRRPTVRLADLVQYDGYVRLTEVFEPEGRRVAEVCAGQPWRVYGSEDRQTAERMDELLSPAPGVLGERYRMRLFDVEDMRRRSGVNEDRLAKRVGIDRDRLLGESFRLWKGRTFSEERDRLAGSDANKQKRGRISRELRAELERELGR